jgi:hypothetical protein
MTETITPERQIAAQQVGAVFNSLHEYLRTLEPKSLDETTGQTRSVLTKQLEFAHCRVDEAAMWAIKSVLTFGVPPVAQPAPAPAPAAANETPAPIGEVDAAAPVADVASPAPAESV